jgi:1,2-phenylacetyl-CoA epoxidase catalytic subunit
MDEETKALLRRIVESQAWRQIAAMNVLGHCLKHVTDVEDKIRVARQLEGSLRVLQEVRELYAELGWTDLESAVRDRVEDMPLPESRHELSICRKLCDLAERVAMEAYVDSSSKQFAAIARTTLAQSDDFEKLRYGRFAEFCAEEGNRPRAQQLLNRWLSVTIPSFGRPGSRGDVRAVELGLRSTSSAGMIERYFSELRPLLEETGLALPDDDTLGLELPAGARAAAAG